MYIKIHHSKLITPNSKFIPFLLLIIVACNSSQVEITWDEKLFSQNNDVLLYQQKAFSGTLVKYYSNKKLASKQNFTEGKLEGLTEKWFENGQIQERRFYSQNHKTGKHKAWWENGQKRFEYEFENDAPIKNHKEWYPNGQLFSVNNYDENGQPAGVQQMWFDDGKIKANYEVKNGRRFGLLGAKGCMGNNEKTLLNEN